MVAPGSALKSDHWASTDQRAHGVSFIVFSFNSESIIAEAIQRIIGMKDAVHKFEVLLLDNNSTDRTIEVVEKLLSEGQIDYRILKQEKPGLFYSRVAGIAAAKYSYFIFVDDDNRLKGNWVDAVCFLLDQKPDIGLIAGVNTAVCNVDLPEWWSAQQHAYAVGRPNIETGPVAGAFSAAWGAGLSGRTALVDILYREVRFWLVGRTGNALLAGEDSELSYWVRLLGYSIYQSELQLEHYISSHKLNEKYLLGLHKGFRISDQFLLQYRIALTGVSWFGHQVNYGFWLGLKCFLAPFRLFVANGIVQKLDIKSKAPAFGECFDFWTGFVRMNKVIRSIRRTRKKLRPHSRAMQPRLNSNREQ